MKLAPFVPLRSTLRILALSGAKLSEVLGSSRNDICEELHLDPAKRFAW